MERDQPLQRLATFPQRIEARTSFGRWEFAVSTTMQPLEAVESITDDDPDYISDPKKRLQSLVQAGLLSGVDRCIRVTITSRGGPIYSDGEAVYFLGENDAAYFWNIYLPSVLRGVGLGSTLFQYCLEAMPPTTESIYLTLASPDGRDLVSQYDADIVEVPDGTIFRRISGPISGAESPSRH